MKIQKNKFKKNKFLVIAIALVVVVTGSYIGAAAKLELWPFSKDTPSSEEKDTNSTNNTSKGGQPVVDNDKGQEINPGNTSDQVPVNESASAEITELDQRNNNVLFTAIVKNVTQPGTCVVTFSNPNDKPVTREVESTIKDGVTVCGTITIPQLLFTYIGTWDVEFHFYSSNQQVQANGKIDIR